MNTTARSVTTQTPPFGAWLQNYVLEHPRSAIAQRLNCYVWVGQVEDMSLDQFMDHALDLDELRMSQGHMVANVPELVFEMARREYRKWLRGWSTWAD